MADVRFIDAGNPGLSSPAGSSTSTTTIQKEGGNPLLEALFKALGATGAAAGEMGMKRLFPDKEEQARWEKMYALEQAKLEQGQWTWMYDPITRTYARMNVRTGEMIRDEQERTAGEKDASLKGSGIPAPPGGGNTALEGRWNVGIARDALTPNFGAPDPANPVKGAAWNPKVAPEIMRQFARDVNNSFLGYMAPAVTQTNSMLANMAADNPQAMRAAAQQTGLNAALGALPGTVGSTARMANDATGLFQALQSLFSPAPKNPYGPGRGSRLTENNR